jgi:tRNA dimethylallyltransferase
MAVLMADVLVGATACGKSAVAQWIAERNRGRCIISADSMAVYRGMDVGTAKPDAGDRRRVRYFGVDQADPDVTWSAGAYLAALREEIAGVGREAERPIVVGGTGLYVQALAEGLDAQAGGNPDARRKAEDLLAEGGLEALQEATKKLSPEEYAKIRDAENPRRVIRAFELFSAGLPWPTATERPLPTVVGIRRDPEDLKQRIAQRVRRMFAWGLVDEAKALRERGAELSDTARHAIGYEEAFAVLDGTMNEEQAIERTIIRTRQYSKRQMTWFRHQAQVLWVDIAPDASIERMAGLVESAFRRAGLVALRGLA